MNSTQEREINLVDLFWKVCLSWRLILLLAIVFMLLLGGFSYVKNATPEPTEETVETEESASEPESVELSQKSLETIDQYHEYLDLYIAQKDYNDHAPLMQLDSAGFYRSKISYYVGGVEAEELQEVASGMGVAYLMALNGNDFAEKMYALLEGPEESKPYLKELVSTSLSFGSGVLSANLAGGIMEIYVYGRDEDSCEKLANLVEETISGRHDAVAESFGEHDLLLLGDVCTLVSDSDLRAYQKRQLDTLASYETAANNVKAAMTEDERLYLKLNGEDEEEESEEPEQQSEQPEVAAEPVQPLLDWKYVAIGFVGGAFLGCFLVAFAYILSGKLRLVDDIEEIYKIKLLGQIEEDRKSGRKRLFGFIDGWIIKLRDWNKHHFTREEAISMVVAGVRICAKNADISQIYVTGAHMGREEKNLVKELAARLEENGIILVSGNPILYNAEALELSSEIGQVLLLEKAEASLYQEVADELETCSYQGIKVLGMIMIA